MSQCHCSRCRRQDQISTAHAYLISLNLQDLLYSPENAPKVFNNEYQRSSNPIDMFLKESFERIVRTCDLTQACQVRLNQNPAFDNMVPERH